MIETYVKQYEIGLTIRQIAEQNNVSYETVRKVLKGKVEYRKKYVSDFTEKQITQILKMFDDGQTVKQIAKWFEISPPAISRLLKANNRKPDSSAKRYEILRATPISFKQKQFLVGHLLGDGCIYRDGKNSLFKVSLGQKKTHEQYFHWKRVMLDPFVNTWRENTDKRKNSVMLHATTIVHPGLTYFANEFYKKDRVKIVPKNLDLYFTPLTLAVWIMDDGNLNNNVNMRIATMGFSHDDQIRLQGYLRSVFDIRSKIMGYRYKNKEYEQITMNKQNTQKLSDIIRPHIVECMKYKIMSESSTTTRQAPERDDDIV
jgi:DNA-binding CsgD family transcriptional regulator